MNLEEPPSELIIKPTVWQELKNALRGTDADYTKIALSSRHLLTGRPNDP